MSGGGTSWDTEREKKTKGKKRRRRALRRGDGIGWDVMGWGGVDVSIRSAEIHRGNEGARGGLNRKKDRPIPIFAIYYSCIVPASVTRSPIAHAPLSGNPAQHATIIGISISTQYQVRSAPSRSTFPDNAASYRTASAPAQIIQI